MASKDIRVTELFAGVGGFRLGLEAASDRYATVMADQWEPGKKRQVAAEVYARRFGYDAVPGTEGLYVDDRGTALWSRDIAELVKEMEGGGDAGERAVPWHDLLVGGFPCFLAGTEITVRDGSVVSKRPIEDVGVGDEVLTHLGEWKGVTAVFRNPLGGRPLFRVRAGVDSVVSTGNHPFWSARGVNEPADWVAADSLGDGALVARVSAAGTTGWVPVRVTPYRKTGPEFVYNLEVADHNSYVANGFAVHNCQDYSVAKPLNQSHGIQGKKGVLWWSIRDIIAARRPKAVFLENVDRLLKSPASQRGRDFAIILASLGDLGYTVEWQVVNAADYGFPQRRRRVFIVALREDEGRHLTMEGLARRLDDGVVSRACPVSFEGDARGGRIEGDLWEVTEHFNAGTGGDSPFLARGVCSGREYLTVRTRPVYAGPHATLGGVLQDEAEVDDALLTDPARWAYVKGAKDEERTHPSGAKYRYKEGALPFPDPLDRPSRTILTSEGGSSPSRTTHCVEPVPGRFRRLSPVELERLAGFPDGWTGEALDGKPVSGTQRGFLVGNALVVGVIEAIGRELEKEL